MRPYKYNLWFSQLSSRYSILHKISMCNWLPITHRMTVTKNFTTLLFQIKVKRKFNLGKLVFKHVLGHVKNAAYRKAIGYPSLIFGILTTQKPDIVTLTDILAPLAAEMRINHKLFEGHHLRDVLSRKKAEKMPRRIPETTPEPKPAATPIGQSSSSLLTKSRLLERTIRSHENVQAHFYEQQ